MLTCIKRRRRLKQIYRQRKLNHLDRIERQVIANMDASSGVEFLRWNTLLAQVRIKQIRAR